MTKSIISETICVGCIPNVTVQAASCEVIIKQIKYACSAVIFGVSW